MLVSANTQMLMTPRPRKPGEDPAADAAAGLQGAMLQTLQNNVQTQTVQAATKVQESATKASSQQASEASKISDNVDEAFARTRIGLQLVYAKLPADVLDRLHGGGATNEFQAYMNKTPEERIQDAILQEMGLTKEEVEQMPPEQQQAVAQEIAERMQDKVEMAQAEKENAAAEDSGTLLATLQ